MGGGSGTRTAARSTATTCSSRRSRTSEPPRVQKNTSPSPSPARRRIPSCVGAVTSRASVSSSYRASHTGVKNPAMPGATARPRQLACLRQGHGTDLARRPPGSPFVPTGEWNEDSHGHGRHPPWLGLLAQVDRRLASRGSAGVRREAMLGARYVARREPKVPLNPAQQWYSTVITGSRTPRVWPVSFLASYIYVHRRRSACTAAR
jgi:hypothetical protein